MPPTRAVLIWSALAAAIAIPAAVAASSPLLAWRDPVYIVAGVAGVAAMALLLVQPLLAGGHLPGLPVRRGRRVHRLVGIALVGTVVLHVAALWITSPPDVIDALLLVSPTPFSLWGVIAMWAIFASASLAAFRGRLNLPLPVWRVLHTCLAIVIVLGSVIHSLLIEGTMGYLSKLTLCAAVIAATLKVIIDRRSWTAFTRKRS